MKVILLTLISFFLVPGTKTGGKMALVCGKWKLVGIQSSGKEYKTVDNGMSQTIIIKADGTFDEELYGTMKVKGQWKFSKDSAKLAFGVTEMDGNTMEGLAPDTKPTDSIIKLTADTLVYGSVKYFGKQKIYMHDDMYFVREH